MKAKLSSRWVVYMATIIFVVLVGSELKWATVINQTPQLWWLVGLLDGLVILLLVYQYLYQRQLRHTQDYLQHLARGAATSAENITIPELQQLIQQMDKVMQTASESMKNQVAAEQSKDELITNVSHDLRTPLTSIIGFLGLIEQNPQTSTADVQKYVHIAYQKSLQLRSLVNDLFEYVRANNSNTKLNIQTFDMIQMLEQIDADFELEAKKQHIQMEVISDVPQLIMQADSQKLGRVFNNLVINAIKYGQGADHIWLCAKEQQDRVILQVINNGQAIAPENQQHLFDRFYRVDQSRSTKTGGTGLGLAIAKSLVQMQQGQITVHSDAQQTCFQIDLPKNLTSEGDKS